MLIVDKSGARTRWMVSKGGVYAVADMEYAKTKPTFLLTNVSELGPGRVAAVPRRSTSSTVLYGSSANASTTKTSRSALDDASALSGTNSLPLDFFYKLR